MRPHLFIAGLLVCASADLSWASEARERERRIRFSGNSQAVVDGEQLYNRHAPRVMVPAGSGGETRPAIVSGERVEIGVSDAQTFTSSTTGCGHTNDAAPPANPTSGKSSPTSRASRPGDRTARSQETSRVARRFLGTDNAVTATCCLAGRLPHPLSNMPVFESQLDC